MAMVSRVKLADLLAKVRSVPRREGEFGYETLIDIASELSRLVMMAPDEPQAASSEELRAVQGMAAFTAIHQIVQQQNVTINHLADALAARHTCT